MADEPIKLSDRSHNPMHVRPVEELERALEWAREHPEFDKCLVIMARNKIQPGDDDYIAVQEFIANLADLEKLGLLAFATNHQARSEVCDHE